MRNLGVGIADEQLLTLWHGWRVNGVGNRCPQRAAEENEGDGGPEGVRNQAEQDPTGRVIRVEAAEGGQANTNQSEVNKGQVKDGHVVDQNRPKSAEHVLSELGVTLVQRRRQRTGGLESLSLATKPCRENKGSNDAQGDIRRHPKLVSRASLASVISGGDKENEFANSVRDHGSETSADEPSELCFGGIGNQGFTHGENNGNGKHGDGEQNSVQAERSIEESREALGKRHLLNLVTPQAKVELERGVNSSNSPPGALLKMAAIVLRDSTKLKRLVNIGGFPALAQHVSGCRDILGQRTEREVANVVQSSTSCHVTRSSAPGDT